MFDPFDALPLLGHLLAFSCAVCIRSTRHRTPTRSTIAFQGLPEGHTKPCWPLAGSNIGGHRLARAKDVDAEVAASKRWDLLGNAVTVPVARWLGERLAAPYVYKFHTGSVGNRRMDHLLNEGVPQIEPQRCAWRLAVAHWAR